MNEIVKVVSQNNVLHITLNRPQQLNALSQEVLERLLQIFTDAKMDRNVKGVLLTGEGKGFCAGADIKQLATLSGKSGLAFAKFGQHVFNQLESLGKPSIAAIQGFAFGGGCELAMAATIRLAANNAVFGQPEIKLGVIPGFGGTQRLSRFVGKGRAMELCLTGRKFSAKEAHDWGLVNELTEPDQLNTRAMHLLQELIKFSPMALASIINVTNKGFDLTLEDALDLEASYFGLCCTTKDKHEGVHAFLEKREAVFSGE